MILDGGHQGTAVDRGDRPVGGGNGPYKLHAIKAGFPPRAPRRAAPTLVYDPAAQTITVTLTASGLTPALTPRTSTSAAARARAPVGTC